MFFITSLLNRNRQAARNGNGGDVPTPPPPLSRYKSHNMPEPAAGAHGGGLVAALFGQWAGLFWCVAYATFSVSLSIINKKLFSEHGFKSFFVLSSGQLLASAVLVQLGGWLLPGTVRLGAFSGARAAKIAPLAVMNAFNAILGFAGLRLVNIPMFLVLRRMTTPMVLILEYYIMKKVASPLVKGAIAISVLGTLIAGSSDLTFDLVGYLFTLANNVATASYLVLINKLGTKKGMNTFELLFYNSLMSLPAMAGLAWATGDWAAFRAMPAGDSGMMALFLTSCCMGFFFNLVVFLCTSVNSALATSARQISAERTFVD